MRIYFARLAEICPVAAWDGQALINVRGNFPLLPLRSFQNAWYSTWVCPIRHCCVPKASRGFEPRSLDSESRVLTVTPRGQIFDRVVWPWNVNLNLYHNNSAPHELIPGACGIRACAHDLAIDLATSAPCRLIIISI